jgi:hypothetical protein
MDENEKKQSSSFMYVGLFVGVILLIFILAIFIIFPSQESGNDYSTYKGFSFSYLSNEGVWLTHIQMQGDLFEAPFYNHPYDLETANIIYSPTVITKILQAETIQIALHPSEPASSVLPGVNIARITGKFYQIPTSSALFIQKEERNNSMEYEYPLVDCSNSNKNNVILHIDTTVDASLLVEDKDYPYCILVGAKRDELRPYHDILAVADLLVYKLVGIMR